MNSYVKISITGNNPRLFIKRYFFNKINYSDYKEVNHKKVILKVSYEDYLNIVLKKTTYKIDVIKFYGPVKYIKLLKNNYTFFIAFLIGIMFLFFLSSVCFKLEVVHNSKEIRSLVLDELKENNIKEFYFIPTFNKRKRVIDKIIKENKDKLEWMEIERKGSKLIVKVTERKKNKEKESSEPRHIVAKKSGIIISIVAENGVILKKKNDYVSKGDIIISGDVIKDETVKGQTRALGKVLAETWYMVHVSYPLNYKETIYLNEIKNNLIISFMNKEFSVRKNYESLHLEKKFELIKSKVFPFEIRIEKQRKTKILNQRYTKKQALNKAILVAEDKIKTKLNTDEYIISKKALNFTSNDSKIEIDVFFKVCEDITDYKEVDKSLLYKNIKESE